MRRLSNAWFLPPLAAVLIDCYGCRSTGVIVGAGCAILLSLVGLLVRAPPAAAAAWHRSLGGVVRSFEFLTLYDSWVLATTALSDATGGYRWGIALALAAGTLESVAVAPRRISHTGPQPYPDHRRPDAVAHGPPAPVDAEPLARYGCLTRGAAFGSAA